MRDFLADADRPLLTRHGLTSFDAFWTLDLAPVDEPNVDRGGWSEVCRLELDGQAYFLKRQCNHRTHSLAAPFGEPTFARELRNIRRYAARHVPAIEAAFYAERRRPDPRSGQKSENGLCAVLLTRALTGWKALEERLHDTTSPAERFHLLGAAAGMARQLHAAGMMHGCFYARHIFVRATGDDLQARLIDLEKTRPLFFGKRDRARDLEQFLRHDAPTLPEAERRAWLAIYLDCPPDDDKRLTPWLARLAVRQQHKNAH